VTATYDDLAGVVDLFGALTREELSRALSELAFKQGRAADEGALEDAIRGAIEEYYLVEYERDGETLLAVGPTAFPTLPENAADLPHIMDVAERPVDREALGETVTERFLGEAARAAESGDRERVARLIDVSYDLEAWAPVDVGDARERLDDVVAE
jgi:hypothetical protein